MSQSNRSAAASADPNYKEYNHTIRCVSLSRNSWDLSLNRMLLQLIHAGTPDLFSSAIMSSEEAGSAGEHAKKTIHGLNAYAAGVVREMRKENMDTYDVVAAGLAIQNTLADRNELPSAADIVYFLKYDDGAKKVGVHKPFKEFIETEAEHEARVKRIEAEDQARRKRERERFGHERVHLDTGLWRERLFHMPNATMNITMEAPQGFDMIFTGDVPFKADTANLDELNATLKSAGKPQKLKRKVEGVLKPK